jgi:uncharacterized membrane protein
MAKTLEPSRMEPSSPHDVPDSSPRPVELGATGTAIHAIQTRVISGLILALPIVLTFWIIYWLYSTLKQLILDPIAWALTSLLGVGGIGDLPRWWDRLVAPMAAVALVIWVLYFLGLVVHSRLHRAVDWVLLRVPLVTTIYKAIRNVFHSLETQVQANRFQRVVLVEFPHPGMRALAFVTNSLLDPATGKKVLSVCVLTGVVPPAGFTLFVPEDEVTDLDWSANQTLQAILSGGITAPAAIPFTGGPRVQGATGPIIDSHGQPIEVSTGPRAFLPESSP